jgi:FkbM family methyltransferase
MRKIGEYWVPDIDVEGQYNLERTKIAFENNQGIQIANLHGSLEYVKDSELAIDGGANVGSWTRLLANRFSVVHCFEPYKPAYECLVANISDWNLTGKVILHNKALSDINEKVSVEPAGVGRRSVTCGVTGPGEIEAISIDSINLKKCSFIKLDLEGFEAKALLGAKETIKKYKPLILIENKFEKRGFFNNKSPAEKILNKYGYCVLDKFGDNQIDWLFKHKSM